MSNNRKPIEDKPLRQQIIDNPTYERVNGAIVNTDNVAYQKRLKIIERNQQIDNMEKRIGGLEEKLDIILDILAKK